MFIIIEKETITMKVSVFNPKNLVDGVSIDEHLVNDSKPESISATLLPEDSKKIVEAAEIEMEDR